MTTSLPLPDHTVPIRRAFATDRPIEDYGLIGDMRGAALISSEGAVDWLCMPKFDCTPTFLALLDPAKGGSCRLTLEDQTPRGGSRRYMPSTNILETVLSAAHGSVTVTDFMPVRAVEDLGATGADSTAPSWLVRGLRCEEGTITVRVEIAPRFDWALDGPTASPDIADRVALYSKHGLFVAASRPLRAEGRDLAIETVLHAGETLSLIIGYGDAPRDDLDTLTARLLAETEAYWIGWAKAFTYKGLHEALVLRSALCLKLLTYAPTGALVAAPTTGLPEAIGGERNWDYRFVWTRDASFTAGAFINLGFHREAAEFLRFLHEADHAGQTLRVMYGVDGALPRERRLDHLAGWRGSRPVLAGNLAYKQDQFEIYGELLAALNLFLRSCGPDQLCPSLREDLPDFIRRMAETVAARWREPDHGIWEIRGEPTHQVHTKALCWVAMDRAIKLAPMVGLAVPDHWAPTRDAILAEVLDKGWNVEAGAFTMAYGDTDLDAAVLRLPLLRVIAADDPRMRATSDAIDRLLSAGDLYYRYRKDDGLTGDEGAFAACAFWAVGVRAMSGRLDEGHDLLNKAMARANDLGLFAEEICVETGAFLGNFPQAFTHMAAIQETLRLSEAFDARTAPST